MPKRVVLLTDWDLDLVLSWADVARSASELGAALPQSVTAHDFEDDDEQLAERLRRARLAP